MHAPFRLKAESDFRRVRSEGQSWTHPLFILYATPNREKNFRAGYSISKRVGPAVVRNRIRRRLREILRSCLKDVRLGWDIVIIARQAASSATFANMVEAIDSVLSRSRLSAPVEPSAIHQPRRLNSAATPLEQPSLRNPETDPPPPILQSRSSECTSPP